MRSKLQLSSEVIYILQLDCRQGVLIGRHKMWYHVELKVNSRALILDSLEVTKYGFEIMVNMDDN